MSDPNEIIQQVDEFVTTLDDLISKKASDEALSRIFDSKNEELVKMASLDILNMVGPRLKDRNGDEGDVDEWHNLQSMIEYVVTISTPKEMLLGLLGLLEIAQSDEFFKLIINRLRITFLRLPSQRGDTILWALNELHDYICNIPLPSYLSDLEDKEKAILENSPELNRLESCVSATLTFCEPFVSEAKECKLIATAERRQEQTLAIASFLLKLVERPVAYFEWERQIGAKKNTLKINQYHFECAFRLVHMLFDLKENFLFAAIDWHEMGKLSLECRFTDDDEQGKVAKKIDSVAIGVLAFLIHCQGMCLDRHPQVYSPEYIFEKLLPYAISLLRGDNASLVELGIDFLGIVSQRLLLQSNQALGVSIFWESGRLNLTSYQELFLSLMMVMTYSKVVRIRQLALGLFTRYLGYFDPEGQMLIIRLVYYVFECYDNGGDMEDGKERKSQWYFANKGICGYLIDQYRLQLNQQLCQSNFESPFFRNLPRMLALFTTLRQREETDFLDNYEQYMASLNLVRFLCMLHLNGRYTRLSTTVFARLSKDFVEPMRKGLEISKAHYELDLKNCHMDQQAKLQSIMANGADLDSMAIDAEKNSVLKSALNSFDLMTSLVARVGELLESCLK